MNKNTVLKFLEGYNPNLITVNKYTPGLEGGYYLQIKRNGNLISKLSFNINRTYNGLVLKIKNGNTPDEKYRGQGYGTLLRALATKAGQIAGAKYGTHYGINVGGRSVKRLEKRPNAKPMPTSTGIMVDRLGWRPTTGPIVNTNWRSMESEFNYTKNNMAKVNRYLEKSRVRSPGCTRCSIQ
jgi:hypothetical protein